MFKRNPKIDSKSYIHTRKAHESELAEDYVELIEDLINKEGEARIVDIANHFFCYSFFPNFNWSEHFAQQPEILDYFKKFVEKFNLKDSISFNSVVTEASYDEEAKIWKLVIKQSGRTTCYSP